jgi:hypothetical protein
MNGFTRDFKMENIFTERYQKQKKKKNREKKK